jgi:hypothetical protein
MMHCRSQRAKKIEAILVKYNEKLVERGYYWCE